MAFLKLAARRTAVVGRAMTFLTRRRSDNPHQETWNIYLGEVRVGRIGKRAGNVGRRRRERRHSGGTG